MNEKEWIRNIYNAWVSSYHQAPCHLHSSSSAFPSSSSFFIRHLPLCNRSPAAPLPLFQTPLFCFEKRAWLDSNRGSTVPKLRVLVQYAHQHRNSRHKRSAVHSPPPTPQWTSIFFAIIVVILHGCYCRLLMDFLINYHRCFPRWCLRFLNEVELTRYSWRLWCSLSSPIR